MTHSYNCVDQSSLPASEQRAPEPKKYTGSAIPSRSFQMLQAMVAPENCGMSNSEQQICEMKRDGIVAKLTVASLHDHCFFLLKSSCK